MRYSKTCVVFNGHLLLNADQKHFRMLHGEHSAILSIFIKLLFVIKIFVLSIFEWPYYTGFIAFRKMLRPTILNIEDALNSLYFLHTKLF